MKGNTIHLVNRLWVEDEPFTGDLEMVGELDGFHHALPALNCSKFYFAAGQSHTRNGHGSLEQEVNGWPSKHLGWAEN